MQIRGMEDDPIFVDEGDLSAAENLVGSTADAELFLYPGTCHLFPDVSVDDYDPDQAFALTRIMLQMLGRVDGGIIGQAGPGLETRRLPVRLPSATAFGLLRSAGGANHRRQLPLLPREQSVPRMPLPVGTSCTSESTASSTPVSPCPRTGRRSPLSDRPRLEVPVGTEDLAAADLMTRSSMDSIALLTPWSR